MGDCDPIDPDEIRQGGSGLSRRDIVFLTIPAIFNAVTVWHETKVLRIYEQALAQLSRTDAALKHDNASLLHDHEPKADKKRGASHARFIRSMQSTPHCLHKPPAT